MLNLKCKRCEYEWLARLVKPKQCPRCKSYNWDKIKEEKEKIEKEIPKEEIEKEEKKEDEPKDISD